MSTATPVPETWQLSGDDAKRTLESTGRMRLIQDAAKRLRSADGFSHARSIAYLMALLFIEGVIGVLGLASALAPGGLSDRIVGALQTAVPGPAGRVLTDAVAQAHRAGAGHRSTALWLALVAAIVTGTTLLGQFERGTNRIYGVEMDRRTVRKYENAFLLLCSAGIIAGLGFVCVALGHAIGTVIDNDLWATAWNVARWPLGLLLITAAMVLILRRAPNRHQPTWSWLSMGALLSVALWIVLTAGLALFFGVSHTFGDTYGPLAGIIALLIWSYGSSVAVLFGVSIGAQLEAVRAGVFAPQSMLKVALGQPPPEPARTEPPAVDRVPGR